MVHWYLIYFDLFLFIIIMISIESYSFWRYGSLLKKLMLVIFCLFEYLISYIYIFISFVFQAVWNKKNRIDKCPLQNADAPQNVEWNTFEYSKLSSSIFIYQYYSRFIPYFWVNKGFLNIFTIGTFAYLQPLSSCENKNSKYEFREQKVWKFWAIWDKNIPFWGQKKFFQNSYQYHLYLLIVF